MFIQKKYNFPNQSLQNSTENISEKIEAADEKLKEYSCNTDPKENPGLLLLVSKIESMRTLQKK